MRYLPMSRRQAIRFGAASVAAGVIAADLGSCTSKAAEPDTIILGAGIAGLHAARMLEQSGLSVLVLEGSRRVGGRCWTARDIQGRPEFGAQQIGFGYGRVRATAAQLKVSLVDPPAGASSETRLPSTAISIDGAPPSAGLWRNSPANRLSSSEKGIEPLGLLSHYLFKDNPLSDPLDWRKPEFLAIDKQSLRQYLAEKGASTEALRIINVTIPARNLDDASALDFLRKNYYYAWEAKHGRYSVVADGMSALTDAMSASLKQSVQLEKVVTRVTAKPNNVTVTCADGAVYRARTCINTIPLSVMKDIPVDGPLPAQQREAWSQQRYSQLIQVYFKVRSPFWEKDGLSATMWTDGPAEVFIHSPSLVDPIGTYYSYINGEAIDPLNALPGEALKQKVMAELIRLRPASAGEVEVTHINNWSQNPLCKGHIAYFAPGDIARFADISSQPVGAMYFAGEHHCRVHAGLEGACETAETAALAVMDALAATKS